jgi:23S rRNA pseudouridine2605 synthase
MTTEKIKLIKYLVMSGAGSRRDSQRLLVQDAVEVNGKPVHQPSFEVDPANDRITVKGKVIQPKTQELYYVAMNKPAGTICSRQDDQGRPTIYSLLHHKALTDASVVSAGRLDYNTSGLIILTNDGDFANRLTHPRFGVMKTYIAEIKGNLDDELARKLVKGIYVDDDFLKFDSVHTVKPGKKTSVLKITLREGKNREIRRLLYFFNIKIRSLRRTQIGPFTLENLEPGKYRLMKKAEAERFKSLPD